MSHICCALPALFWGVLGWWGGGCCCLEAPVQTTDFLPLAISWPAADGLALWERLPTQSRIHPHHPKALELPPG